MGTLITGGTGFLGAQVARLLSSRGTDEITLFDVSDSRRRLEDIAGTIHAHPTLGEAVQEAALRALGHAVHI